MNGRGRITVDPLKFFLIQVFMPGTAVQQNILDLRCKVRPDFDVFLLLL
ncbi:hypothetical protein ACQCVE_17650 [Metabacillus sp. 113a]